MKRSIIILCLPLILVSAQCSRKNQAEKQRKEAENRQEDRFEAQRNFLQLEREAIEAYIEDRNLRMLRSGTGLYYESNLDSSTGETASPGDDVEFNYTISLLNGHILYSSEENGSRVLRVEREDAELGVHELLKLMEEGEKALFILPSHLAFGVGGDQNEVPPKTPLAYEIEILQIEKPE